MGVPPLRPIQAAEENVASLEYSEHVMERYRQEDPTPGYPAHHFGLRTSSSTFGKLPKIWEVKMETLQIVNPYILVR